MTLASNDNRERELFATRPPMQATGDDLLAEEVEQVSGHLRSELLAQEARPAAATALAMSALMQPADANFMGVIHGGAVMKLIDEVAAACAYRFCRQRVVTVAIDGMDFHHPVAVGSLLTLRAAINHAGKTSMEVGVRVETEDLASGQTIHTNSAYLVFVALDGMGRPTRVPHLILENEEERARWRAAEDRQVHRRGLRGNAA
jgi:acyl-CoA hydrolase